MSSVDPPPPLYVRIIEDIQHRIRTGEWPVGHPVPRPQDLSASYAAQYGESVSVGTIRRAIERLQDRGVLVGRQGKGVFVARVPD